MDDQDFKELAGRVEGTARALLLLIAELHLQGSVDEQLLQAKMRRLARQLPPMQSTASTTLTELADQALRHYNQQRSGSHGQESADP